LVFQSHKQHGVAALTGRSSRRNIMVCELWEGLPRRCMRRCDQPWLPCYCRPDFTEYHRTVRGVVKASPGTSARLDPKYRCERDGLSDIERLRVNGLAYHARQRAEREAAEREAAEGRAAEGGKEGGPGGGDSSDALKAWAAEVAERRRRETKLRPGE